MKREHIQYSPEEEEAVNLLITVGTKRDVAKVLAFLVRAPEATCYAIECGTRLRESEVSRVMQYLGDKGWILRREVHPKDGHPTRMYTLTKTVPEIITQIVRNGDEAANKIR
jgi:predicted transcriptional regulator